MNRFRYVAGAFIALFCLWIVNNAMVQTREVSPGETRLEILRSLIKGRPGGGLCPASVHDSYTAIGPDGQAYPTWHSPFDRAARCYFDHEHGSDPHSYAGFNRSGMPLFGYTSRRAGIVEPHKGYKVYVTNDDLNGRAWMILLNQDTGAPGRALVQFHTVDWHISSLSRDASQSGETLVDIHVLGDFGFAIQNCSGGKPIPGSEQEARYTRSGHPRRIVLTANCAATIVYERWESFVQVGGVFEARPLFDIDNPATAVDLEDLGAFHPTCQFRPVDEGCEVSRQLWSGNVRSVMHPGQWVQNDGPDVFYTDPYGSIEIESNPDALRQFVTRAGWDTRQCCGNRVVFRLQSFSNGVYIANPQEPAGMVEFIVGR